VVFPVEVNYRNTARISFSYCTRNLVQLRS